MAEPRTAVRAPFDPPAAPREAAAARPHESPAQARDLWPLAVAILLLAVVLRTVALERLPLFVDETTHIFRARWVLDGDVFNALRDQKWLYTVVLAAFTPTGPESVWIARVVSALSSVVTVAGAIALGRQLTGLAGSRTAAQRVGLTAGLIYAVLPMAVFHERQALVDPLLGAFVALATLGMVRLARRPSWVWALFLWGTLAGAYLTKASALPWLALPFIAAMLFAHPKDRRRALGFAGGAVALTIGLVWAILQVARAHQDGVWDSHQIAASNTLLSNLSSPETQAILIQNLRDGLDAMLRYVGVIPLGFALLGAVWAIRGEHRRALLFLAFPAVAFLGVPIVLRPVTVRGYMPPRYFLPNALPLAVLAALSLDILVQRLWNGHRQHARWTMGLALVGVLLPSLWFADVLIRTPSQAFFTRVDRDQYLNLYHQDATQDIAGELREVWKAADGADLDVLATDEELRALGAYLGPRVGETKLLDRTDENAHTLAGWLVDDDLVYVVQPQILAEIFGPRDDTLTETYGTYGTLNLARVTGTQDELATEIYDLLAQDPALTGADADATAAELAADSETGRVIVFPGNHAAGLEDAQGVDLALADPRTWPVQEEQAGVMLGTLLPAADNAVVDVVTINEDRTDPANAFGLALQHTLYRTGLASWHGLFHRQRFVTGPADPTLRRRQSQFGGVVQLAGARIVDEEASPGSAVRIAVAWRATAPPDQPLNVFVHAIGVDGQLQAQHDSVPGGGLLPISSWEPGRLVADRFAIPLPEEIPPGEYEVRIGIYNPNTGQRLAVTGSDAIGVDYAVLGSFTVTE